MIGSKEIKRASFQDLPNGRDELVPLHIGLLSADAHASFSKRSLYIREKSQISMLSVEGERAHIAGHPRCQQD